MTRPVWLTFTALCLLAALASFAEPSEPSPLPSLLRRGLLHAAIGFAALIFSLLPSTRRRAPSTPDKSLARAALTSLLFFGLPTAILEFAGAVSSISGSAIFAIVPIVVIITTTTLDARESGEAGARGLLLPALTGAAGLYLLLSFNLSTSPRGILVLAATSVAVILIGASSVWLHRQLQDISLPELTAAICLTNAAFLLTANLATRSLWTLRELASILSLSSVIDIAEILLLLWLLRAMPPIRFAARYLLIPLLTVAEGFLLVRPPLTLRIAGGITLLAAGTAMLLFLNPSSEDGQTLSLR